MATTYLEAVNDVLVESNEVELTTVTFSTAVGVQQFVKNALNRAYLEICAKEEQWPFLAAAASNTNDPYAGNVTLETVSGTRWYLLKTGATSIANDFGKVDWDSFFLTSDGGTGQVSPFEYQNLTYTTFDQWRTHLKPSEDADAGSDGSQSYGLPTRIIESKDGRYFGLSPIPDGAYDVYFSAWVQPTKLSADDDAILIPDMYIPVLLQRARWYLLNFKKDTSEADRSQTEYTKGLRGMISGLLRNQSDYMSDDWSVRRNF